MKRIPFVVVMAITLAASSLAFCAEGTPEDFAILQKLLDSAGELIREKKLEDAEEVIDDAVMRYRKLRNEDKVHIEKVILRLTLDLAGAWNWNHDYEDSTGRCLRCYETHWRLRADADQQSLPSGDPPDTSGVQRGYADVLGMALADCGYDVDEMGRKYPALAGFWSLVATGDFDGNGMTDFMNQDLSVRDQTTYSFFFIESDGSVQCFTLGVTGGCAGFKVFDDDGDGADEFLIIARPEKRCRGVENSIDGPRLMYDWRSCILVTKFKRHQPEIVRHYCRYFLSEPECEESSRRVEEKKESGTTVKSSRNGG